MIVPTATPTAREGSRALPTDAPRPGGPGASAEPGTTGLVLANLELVTHAVRELSGRIPAHVSREDLTAAAALALVQSARAFDPARGVPFAAFATRRMRGALLDELRALDWATRSVRRRDREVVETRHRLYARLGRVPTDTELAAAAGLSARELSAHAADVARACVGSLDAVPGDLLDGLVGRRPVEPDTVLLHREQLAYVRDAVAALPARLATVVRGSFFEDRTTASIAAELGVTESRVSQMRTEALGLIRDALDAVTETDPDAAAAAAPGVARRRRSHYVDRVRSARAFGDRLALVPETELGVSA